jgi:ribosomal protein L14E/L6E/L27E
LSGQSATPQKEQESAMIGQFAISKAGHDKGVLYVIVAEEGDFVALCDGRLKPLKAPKRKRRKHIQPINRTVRAELAEDIRKDCAADEQIKYAIRQYRRQTTQTTDTQKET